MVAWRRSRAPGCVGRGPGGRTRTLGPSVGSRRQRVVLWGSAAPLPAGGAVPFHPLGGSEMLQQPDTCTGLSERIQQKQLILGTVKAA